MWSDGIIGMTNYCVQINKICCNHENKINIKHFFFVAVEQFGVGMIHTSSSAIWRGVDFISPTQKGTIFTLQSPHMSAVPSRFDAHPYNVDMLAGATNSGQVYMWTLG